MPDFAMTVRHRLSREEATTRIKKLLREVRDQYDSDIGDVKEDWDPYAVRFRCTVRGYAISGVITVGWFQVKLEGELPQAIAPLQKGLESIIREQARVLLS